MPVDRRAAQRRKTRKQRRTAVLVLLLFALVAGIGVAARHQPHARPGTASTPTVTQARQLAPPGPIPGYLLIADRGNNRMLLVDSNKHILWSYPRPGQGTSFPFRFDDDTFFGPGLKTIISNQEGQHTIQIITFPGGRVIWYYGHIG